jgi:uncharacterized SAM-binding protein YcdF (DUF218 family)
METVIEKFRVYLKQHRALRWLIALAIVGPLAYAGLPPTMNRAARALIRSDELVKSDVIVALGGDPRCNREKHAVELYRQSWAGKIVVSGAEVSPGLHTADAAKRYVMSLGVPEADVLVIRDTWNTRMEAIELEKLMLGNRWRRAILVTSAFHSRRAAFTVERAAADFEFRSAPVPTESPEWQPDRWWTRRMDVGLTVREWIAWTNTILGGWQ